MTRERLHGRICWRRVSRAVVVCALLLDLAMAASPVQATRPVPVKGADDVGVLLLADSPAVSLGAWSTSPVTLRLVAQRAGSIYYRWGAGPGEWRNAEGPLIAPEGKERLSFVLVDEHGVAGPTASVIVRSDFHARSLSRPISTGIATTAAAAAAFDAGNVSVRAIVLDPSGVDMRRLGGRSRYDTGVTISKTTYPAASTVLVASGENFPDALSASGLAGCLHAPVLLTQRTTLPPAVADEIERLGADTAIICGGPNAVDPVVEAQLKALGIAVERIGGRNRYAVAAGIAQRIEQLEGPRGRVLVARGDLYPDSLALSPAAYHGKTPILLVLPTAMPAETSAELRRGGYSAAFIAGGSNSVSSGVASQVSATVGAPATRWAGKSRYETAAVVAGNAGLFGNSWAYVGVATGEGFADALGGGAAAGEKAGVILLTQAQVLSEPTRAAIDSHVGEIDFLDVYGGTVAVSAATYEEIRALVQ